MKAPEPKKLSFSEAWETMTEFFVDDSVEEELEIRIDKICVGSGGASRFKTTSLKKFVQFLRNESHALDAVLVDIGLPREKFKRIVTLMRRKGKIPGGFDSEWGIDMIKRRVSTEDAFARTIANALFHGNKNSFFKEHLPKYYREKLNWKEINVIEEKRGKIKESVYRRTYANIRGKRLENLIKNKLEFIKRKHAVGYGRGRSRIINVDIDWAVPDIDDPQVIIMVWYQETTSSGMSSKTRDMENAYNSIRESNSRHRENRAFVNFVDGGGWLARKVDFTRLVDNCHYFLNLKNLDMLEAIVLKHVS